MENINGNSNKVGRTFLRHTLVFSFGLLVVLVIFLWWQANSNNLANDIDPELPATAKNISEETVSNTIPGAGYSAAEIINAERQNLLNNLPSSLQDVLLPEALDVNSENELVINLKIRRMFDFYLSASGEEEIEVLIERIQLNLIEQLPEPALGESLDILDGYLQYKRNIDILRANTISTGMSDLDNIMQLKLSLRASRAEHLDSEVAEAFFSQEDAYDDYQIAKSRILSDNRLSAVEQNVAIDSLKANSPQWIVSQEQSANRLNYYRETLKNLNESQASDAQIYSVRQQQFGHEATERLSKLDQERQNWTQRLTDYRRQLSTRAQGLDGNSTEFLSLADALRSQHFSGNELVRVRALDELYFR